MTDDLRARMNAAFRDCDRILSGKRPPSMAEQLAELSGSGYDLDELPDAYGNGLVADLETRVAGLFGKAAAAFFPSGTMAQQVALRCWSDRAANPTVALHPLHHTETFERKAYATLTGLRAVWPTSQSRQPSADEIRDMDEPFATLVVELPLRTAGYLLPTWTELTDIVAAAHDRGAYVHFDGARLWESAPHLGQDLPTIAALADSVYVSFYKTIGALAGAALVGPEDFIATAKAWRHRYGGQVYSQWPTVLSALIGLDHELPKLPSYVEHAKVIAAALATLPGAIVNPSPPHTHQFQLWLPHSAAVLNEAAITLAEQNRIRFVGPWRDEALGRALAEVTVSSDALAWSANDVIEAGAQFLKHVANGLPDSP